MNFSVKNIDFEFTAHNQSWAEQDLGHDLLTVFTPMLKAWGQICCNQWSNFNHYHYQISLHYCHGQQIRTLNNKYRNKNKMTDVLSFPVHENPRENWDFEQREVLLGDLFIARSILCAQAKQYGQSPLQEFYRLCTHGFVHLLGFDHEISRKEEKIMQQFEQKILEKLSS